MSIKQNLPKLKESKPMVIDDDWWKEAERKGGRFLSGYSKPELIAILRQVYAERVTAENALNLLKNRLPDGMLDVIDPGSKVDDNKENTEKV